MSKHYVTTTGRWLKILELKFQKCNQLHVALDHRSWFNGVKNVDDVWDE